MSFRFNKALKPAREVGFPISRSLGRSEDAWRSCTAADLASGRTSIIVHLELGPHNGLFVRGRGGGLSWNEGQPLSRLERAIWTWSTGSAKDRLEFQLLLDDMIWERSQPHFLAAGHTVHISPDFEWPEIPRVSSPDHSVQVG